MATLYSPIKSYTPIMQTICALVFVIFDWSFGWGLRTSNLGKRVGIKGSGMVSFEGTLVSSYRPSTVSSIFTRFRYIILPLLFSTLRHFSPTPPIVCSLKFLNVPLRIGESPFGYKERRCWANSLCN